MPLSQRPLIGITTSRSDADWVSDHLRSYIRALRAPADVLVVLAPDAFDSRSYALGPRVGALLLSGGGDLHPRHYGQAPAGTEMDSIDEDRDEMELALARQALAANLPILAICRGVQVLNVAMGGSLLQHVEGHRQSPSGESARHEVHVAPESLLAQVLGLSGTLQANSRHHQAIDAPSLAPALRASAWSLPDAAVVEAVEAPGHRWVLGVQWHPERASEVPKVHGRLFSAFVAAAGQAP